MSDSFAISTPRINMVSPRGYIDLFSPAHVENKNVFVLLLLDPEKWSFD